MPEASTVTIIIRAPMAASGERRISIITVIETPAPSSGSSVPPIRT